MVVEMKRMSTGGGEGVGTVIMNKFTIQHRLS